jgi:hypothetical protein
MVAGPNFFIVGAAKAGTTAIHAALQQHPEIYMSRVKEPGFFSPDISVTTEWNGDLASYLSLFADAGGATVRGESSPAYLYSTLAADRISEFAPDARILIVLRNPVDVITACYAEARKWGTEPSRSLAAAVKAARSRTAPSARPSDAWLRYFEVVDFSDQVERYLKAFPRQNVHIMRYDDLDADPREFLRSVLEFLGVEQIELTVGRANPSTSYRSAALQRLLMRPFAAGSPTPAVRSQRFRRRLLMLNHFATAPKPSPELRATLTAELAPGVERLGALTGLDVTGWLPTRR